MINCLDILTDEESTESFLLLCDLNDFQNIPLYYYLINFQHHHVVFCK